MLDPDYFISLNLSTDSSSNYSFTNSSSSTRGSRRNIRSVSTNPTRRNNGSNLFSSPPSTAAATTSTTKSSMNRSFFTNSGYMYGPPICASGTGSVASLSPFHVAGKPGVNNVVAVGTKTKSLSLLIDRSGDYNYNTKRMGMGGVGGLPGGSSSRDQSLDRQTNYSDKKREYYVMGSRWDRASADRDYTCPPNLGSGGAARSLERENQMRTHSFDGVGSFLRGANEGEDGDVETPSPTTFYPNNESSLSCRDGFVLDLQAQIADLNKECAILQQDLDLAKDKLNSTMNSIKSFWSPELKKERTMRKEENLKYVTLNEQLKAVEIENRQHLTSLMKLEQENRQLRESSSSSSSSAAAAAAAAAATSTSIPPTSSSSTGTGVGVGLGGDFAGLPAPSSQLQPQQQQQQSLLSSPPPPPTTSSPLEMLRKERDKYLRESKLLRKTVQEMEMRIETQQKTMATRDSTIQKLMDLLQQQQQQQHQHQQQQQQTSSNVGQDTPTSSREETLQRELQQKGSEVGRMLEEAGRNELVIQQLRSQEKLLKEKLETSRQDLKRSETEQGGLRTRLDILQKHFEDHDKHVNMLREQVISKEQQCKMLSGDVEMLRRKVEEKEELISAKSKQLITVQSEKAQLTNQLSDLKDKLDDLGVKFNAQLRKIDSLEEMTKEKEMLINSTRLQLDSVKVDRSSTDSALVRMQDALEEKEKQIDKLKEQREKLEREMEDMVRQASERSSEVKLKVTQLQSDVISKQEMELELRNEVGRLKSEISTKDALISSLEVKVSENGGLAEDLQRKFNKVSEDLAKSQSSMESTTQQHLIELDECKQEVRRLKVELSEKRDELMEKKAKISKLEQDLAGISSKGPRRDDNGDDEVDDVTVFKSILTEKDSRIEELESAMRESIKITAQREIVMAEQQMKLEHTERLMESLQEELERARGQYEGCREQLSRCEALLKEKEALLTEHLSDSKKQLSEVYEMKQEAILAAISEKDAHIALLEMAPNKKTENIEEVERLTREKGKLQQVLRDLTQSRMKLLQTRGHLRSSSASSLLHYATHRDVIMQKVDFGTFFVYHNEMLNDDDDAGST